MLLYHGTSEQYLENILKKGIIPRSYRKDRSGNWKIKSNQNAVYLTNAYAVFYAQSAIKAKEERLVVLEINTDYILPWRLTPDEDFLEQATRKQSIEDDNGSVCSPEMGMHKRTFWYRKRLLQFRHHWEDSLKGLGNCCYHDVIPINAFTRYALLPFNSKISFAVDPCMTLMNYAIMGGYYRELTKHVFGDPLDLTADCQMEYIARLPRDNVEVRKMKT